MQRLKDGAFRRGAVQADLYRKFQNGALVRRDVGLAVVRGHARDIGQTKRIQRPCARRTERWRDNGGDSGGGGACRNPLRRAGVGGCVSNGE